MAHSGKDKVFQTVDEYLLCFLGEPRHYESLGSSAGKIHFFLCVLNFLFLYLQFHVLHLHLVK